MAILNSIENNVLKISVLLQIGLLCFSCYEVNTQIPESDVKVTKEVLADGFEIPYSIAVIGEDDYLITERMGALFRYRNGELTEVNGLPESKTFTTDRPYGGMMDLSLHPRFNINNLVYLSYVDKDYHLAVARFKLEENTAKDVELIFTSDQFCIGSRIEWEDDTHFFLSFGVGGAPGPEPGPQDLTNPKGKIFRLMADGSIPADNPVFPGMKEPTGIWSYGHRDPQGLYYDKEDSQLYANEHGPLGGDELNIITKGGNYGWPLFSYGLNYDLSKVSEMTEEEAAKNTVLPIKYWTPDYRLAPSCLLKLKDSNFKEWNGSFLMGALTYQHLVRYHPDSGEMEVVLPKVGRVRDVAQLPSGDLVILIDHKSPRIWAKGRVVKLTLKK